MPRYFIEIAYKGTHYSGSQIQENAITIQFEVEKAMQTLFKQSIALTGSSRTDTGVHALQNFFHFDTDLAVGNKQLYNINALLPKDIAAKNLFEVKDDAHCRFLASGREYKYFIYRQKDPFLIDRAWFYPYNLNMDLLQTAANVLMEYHDFTSFSKRSTQTKTFICEIQFSDWSIAKDCLMYHVKGNRFLRGMVRGMVGTMLKVGRELISIEQFRQIIEAKDCTKADFTTPPQGLFLTAVLYPAGILTNKL
jgi:tRNA pseudouridine38-40 synthase